MANIDEHGNKLPQPRIKKKDFSRMLRDYRMQDKSCKHCDMCGFKVRTVNHENGRHHQTAPKVIEANRKAAMA